MRRMKIMRVDSVLFRSLLLQGGKSALKTVGLPEDVELRDVRYDPWADELLVKLESETFPEQPPELSLERFQPVLIEVFPDVIERDAVSAYLRRRGYPHLAHEIQSLAHHGPDLSACFAGGTASGNVSGACFAGGTASGNVSGACFAGGTASGNVPAASLTVLVDPENLVGAQFVAPGLTVYSVAVPMAHKTLNPGDRVVMRELGYQNVLVRLEDNTVHALQDESGYYVILHKEAFP